MKKSAVALVLLMSILAGLFLTSCGPSQGSNPTNDPSNSQNPGDEGLKIAMITTVAGLGDEAFNDALLEGTQKYCDENDLKLTVVEPQELQDFQINATAFGQQGYDLVFIVENTVNDIIREVAPQFPDTRYVLIEGAVDDVDNITCLQFKTEDVGFLCGAFAAAMSQELGGDGSTGWVGGVRTPITESTMFSTMAGAAYMGGDCQVAWVGSYTDIGKAKEIALQMYNGGANIVTVFAGGANSGVFQAAESFSEGKYAMGAGLGQFHLSPERIVASNVKAMDTFTYETCKKFAAGELESGIIIGGFQEKAVELRYSTQDAFVGFVPEELKEKMSELQTKIENGEIDAPSNQEEYDAFIAALG